MTFPGLEMTILEFHDFSRFSMTVRTLILFPGLSWNSLELAEDVGVLGWDAGGLQDGDSKGEGAADLQVGQRFLRGEVQRKIQTQTWTLHRAAGSLYHGYTENTRVRYYDFSNESNFK